MSSVRQSTVVEFSGFSMTQLQDSARVICDNALERAWPPAIGSRRKRQLKELLQDRTFLQRFKKGLAEGAADILAANDERVQSVHLFEETAVPTETYPPPPSRIQLLILVTARSAALDALTSALDQALIREVRNLPVSLLSHDESLLNPLIITEANARQHQGYAMLLYSTYPPPLTIWKRDEAD